MPVVFRHRGYRFFFYSNEGNPREPMHIHVGRDGHEAKFWLHPGVALASNDGFGAKALRELAGVVESRQAVIERAWHDFFD